MFGRASAKGVGSGGVAGFAWVFAAVAVLIIAYGVTAPHDPIPRAAAGQDKIEHFVAFAGLTALVLFPRGAWLVRLVLLLEAVVLIELAQKLFVPTRDASWLDALSGAVGVLVGAIVVYSARVFVARAKQSNV